MEKDSKAMSYEKDIQLTYIEFTCTMKQDHMISPTLTFAY